MSAETQWHPITTRSELDLKHNRSHSEVSAGKERSLILKSHGSRTNLEVSPWGVEDREEAVSLAQT